MNKHAIAGFVAVDDLGLFLYKLTRGSELSTFRFKMQRVFSSRQ